MVTNLTSPAPSLSGTITESFAGTAAPAPGRTFAEVISKVAKDGVAQGKQAEELTAQAIAGQADINQVVLAVTSAELTLQTVVAVRDKVVQSYQDIMRMPI
ncbi:MAG: flagellar hook-basal body complex protein FliE [Pseudomonadota bacterium]